MPTPKLSSSTGQIWSDFAAADTPSPMLRQKPGCSVFGCGGGSGSRRTKMQPASTMPECSSRSGRAPNRSAVEAQAMPKSWPPNCSAVASATALGRPPLGATTGSRASRVGMAKAPIAPAITP